MNIIQRTLSKIDDYQQAHRLPGFIYGVVKKYGDDEAGYESALLTYYGFLSLFPLLLVLTTVTGIVARSNPHLQSQIIDAITSYFPVLGNQLSSHIQGISKSGPALVIGVLFTLYGARGVADAFRHGVNHIWQVPHEQREGFPKGPLKSLAIICLGAIGLIGASFSASLVAAAGTGLAFKAVSLVFNIVILYILFTVVLKVSLPYTISFKETKYGAVFAAIGLVLLQGLGGYLLSKELKNLDALYSNFALALSLLFWLYLQAQVLYYAVEMTHVRTHKLWPRSLTGNHLTDADKQAYDLRVHTQQMVPEQAVTSSFRKKAPYLNYLGSSLDSSSVMALWESRFGTIFRKPFNASTASAELSTQQIKPVALKKAIPLLLAKLSIK